MDELKEDERLVFFINVYNALYLHAVIRHELAVTQQARKAFWQHSYDIGGKVYTLEGLHYVLRGENIYFQWTTTRLFLGNF